jgi:aminopeptidase N
MRVILLICMFAAAAFSQMPRIEPGVSQELAKWRASQYSNISYKLNLTLEKMSPVLRGTIEIRVTQAAYACAAPNCPPLMIVLDWRKIPGHEKHSTISSVSLNGKILVGDEEGNPESTYVVGSEPKPILSNLVLYELNEHLVFRNGVVPGENVIKLDFTSPILTSGSAITRYIDKEDGSEYIYSLFVPSDASTAFPCFDQPDLKARFKLSMTVPSSWKSISNTPLPTDLKADLKATYKRWLSNDVVGINFTMIEGPFTDEFPETQPISTYVFAFAAGPWAKSEPGAVATGFRDRGNKNPVATAPGSDARSVYVRKSQLAKFQPHAAEVARLRDDGIKYLEQYFDYKFPFPKLDIVLIPEFPFGGMEHAGAVFLREDRVIFPAEPTAGDYITRANVIFHETAHQWFGDTVTMKWFDDLWLKEGFAEFMAFKTMEKVMPQYNAWKVFYERNKQAAYLTDSTKGTTPIYQPIANLNSAKSAYGNIVYRKAPSFLRQAEFYLGEDKFQTAVRAFLKKHEFANAGWEDLVREFEDAAFAERIRGWTYFPRMPKTGQDEFENKFRREIRKFAECWVKQRGAARIRGKFSGTISDFDQEILFPESTPCDTAIIYVEDYGDRGKMESKAIISFNSLPVRRTHLTYDNANYIFPNYKDYGYGIFLLDDKSRDYVLKNIRREKDPFLRSMMWGSLWDSVREAELDPREYVGLVIKNLPTEPDETTVASLVRRVSTALNYYLSEPPPLGGGTNAAAKTASRPQKRRSSRPTPLPPAHAGGSDLRSRFENVLLDRLQHAPTAGQRITFYRAFVANATTAKGREVLKQMLEQASRSRENHPVAEAATPLLRKEGSPKNGKPLGLRTKDKFDIVTRLIILGDADAPKLLSELERTETSDDAKRYAYAARAAFGTAENKAKFFADFTSNKNISESWIESAIVPFNSIRHADLTQPYLERALKELPNLKRTRKIFFINNWLSAVISGQRDEKALAIVNKFLVDNPDLDRDLRLKILENVDLVERAVRIRTKYR